MRRSARWGLLSLVGALGIGTPALSQVVQRCKGESFAELAAQRLGDARLGPLVALFNGAGDAKRCTRGRFVRFPATIRHEVRLGQTIDAIAGRFTRGPGGGALIRERNSLPAGSEPNRGMVLEVPAELAVKLGTRPQRELRAVFGLPSLEVIRAYNATKKIRGGTTIYVPLFFDLLPPPGAPPQVVGPPPPPPPPPPGSPPPAVVDPSTIPDAQPVRTSTAQVGLSRVLQVAIPARYDGFRHPIHEAVLQGGWQCQVCHVADPRRPHEYLPVSEALCTKCHSGAERTDPVLRAYRIELSYNHDQHLSEGGKTRAEGYELACNDCHPAVEGRGRRGQPQHAQCVKCHNAREVKPVVSEDCAGCHATAESMDRRQLAQSLLAEHFRDSDRQTDIVFGHDEHVAQFDAGSEAACDRCHVGARTSQTLADIEPQRMADCLSCHRGLARKLGERSVSLNRCKTCHLSTRAESAPVFSQLLDKPLSHSQTFRRRHGAQAAADDGVCAVCHTELAGDSGANCQACHQQLRPRDHTVRWRETPHGRAAVRAPDRCATCHLEDRCADCHAQAPRDHFPRAVFQLRHGRRARASTRRCLTCHIPQVDCARCHDVGSL